MDSEAKKGNLTALVVTGLIVVGLLVAGPAEAVKVNIGSDKGVYYGNDNSAKFRVSVDIQRNEMVPIKSLELNINDGLKVCDFEPDGSHSCPNIDIALVNPGNESAGNLFGKGFGFTGVNPPSEQSTDFGFGYGFSDEANKVGFKGELSYEITWNFAADNATNGKYSATLEAFAENDGTEFTYVSKKQDLFNINVHPTPPEPERHEAKIRAGDGEIISVKNISGFTVQKVEVVADLMENGNDHGYAVLNVYGEKTDSTKITMQVKIKGFDISELSADKVDMTGNAEVEYHKTKQGVWQNGARTGFEPNEIIRQTISNVHFVVEDDVVSISSDDSTLPFSVEADVIEYRFR